MATFALLVLTLTALAGCASDEPEPVQEEVVPEEPTEETVRFGPHSGLPTTQEDGAVAERNLNEPPQWVLGEWWQIRLTSFFDGKVTETTRIVSGTEKENYLVGMPQDTFDNEVMVLHVPGFGLINKFTLGFEAHDIMFDPVQFPLAPGESWTTDFETPNGLTAVVDRVDGNLAYIDISGAHTMNLTYNATLGAIEKMVIANYAMYEVIDHGFGYEGMVTVPHSHDLVFIHGRAAGAVTVGQPGPQGAPANAPVETIHVPDEYDRVSFSIINGEILSQLGVPLPADPGVYQTHVTAPDGTEYEDTKLPSDGPGWKISSFSHDQPAGNWTVRAVAAGPGVAFFEGIAYVVYDVEMPDGCIVMTQRIHNHGGECGGHVHGLS